MFYSLYIVWEKKLIIFSFLILRQCIFSYPWVNFLLMMIQLIFR
jgi:hypothetical protein